jgi:hypothetical protein
MQPQIYTFLEITGILVLVIAAFVAVYRECRKKGD